MRTTKFWLDACPLYFNRIRNSDDVEEWIKAIQDEAFKAGLSRAAELTRTLFASANATLLIVTEHDKLP